MSKVTNQDYSLRQGKMSKDSSVVYRVRNGRQQSYTLAENDKPASKAQKAHRKFFGKVTAIVNAIMADPKQQQEWAEKRLAYNHSVALDMTKKRYQSTRSYIHAVITEQLQEQEAAKRTRKPVSQALKRGYKLHIKHFAELSTTELYELLKARFKVFYTEQGCRYLDMDDVDYQAIHLCIFRKGEVIAYARLFEDPEKKIWHIGRMLTTVRGKGFGRFIMEKTIEEAQRQGARSILIHAQTHAVPFYEKFRFHTIGGIFMEADIPHVKMKKSL